jgi:pilus assembly protein Flp/PilA
MEKIKRFFKEEKGVTMVEYGLIAGLIAIVIIVALASIGTSLSSVFQAVADAIS